MATSDLTEGPIRQPDLIIPRVYLCDLHIAQDAAVALSCRITHIVSVLDFVPTFPQEMDHIKKMHVRLSDSFREKITPHLDLTTEFIRDALKEPESRILIHCVMGISRSATVVCAYLIAENGMTAQAAVDFVREKRPVVCPNVGFRQQLDEYAEKVHGGSKEGMETQVKFGGVPKNPREFRLWMRGRVTKKKEIDTAVA